VRFRRKPEAPALTAPRVVVLLEGRQDHDLHLRAQGEHLVIPSRSGMRTSMRTESGRSDRTSSITGSVIDRGGGDNLRVVNVNLSDDGATTILVVEES
jgi:hypothetical protein